MNSPEIMEPSACTWCGIAKRGHGRQYADAVGYHAWEMPTDAQIKARMQARRLVRVVAREGALPMSAGLSAQEPVDKLTRTFVPVASLRESLEDPHDSPLHHDYPVGRDLPETGGTR